MSDVGCGEGPRGRLDGAGMLRTGRIGSARAVAVRPGLAVCLPPEQEKERRGRHFEQPDEMTFGRGKQTRKPNPKYASFSQARWAAVSHFSHESESYARAKVKRNSLNDAFLAGLDWSTAIHELKSPTSTLLGHLMALHMDVKTGTLEAMHPMVLVTKADAADNPRWHDAMNGPDAAGFMEACKKEIELLCWKVCSKMRKWALCCRMLCCAWMETLWMTGHLGLVRELQVCCLRCPCVVKMTVGVSHSWHTWKPCLVQYLFVM